MRAMILFSLQGSKSRKKGFFFFFFQKVPKLFLGGCPQQSEVAGKTQEEVGVVICGCGSHQQSRATAPSGPEHRGDSYSAGSPLFGSLF